MPIMMMPSFIMKCKDCKNKIEVYDTTRNNKIKCGNCGTPNQIKNKGE